MNWDEKILHAAQFVDHDPDAIGDAEYADGYVDGVIAGAKWQRDQLKTSRAIEGFAKHKFEDFPPGDQMHQMLGIPETWDELVEKAKSDESLLRVMNREIDGAKSDIAALLGEG